MLAARLRAHLGRKIAVWLGLAVGICVPYFTLQRVHVFPVREVPPLPLDRWIPFDPGWIWAYVSIALLVPLAPLLAAQRAELTRYAKGLALLCVACFAAFLLFPVWGPRPAEIAGRHALYALIASYDRPANSLPSLHAGLTAYSLLFAWRVLRGDLGRAARAAVAATGALWGALILYSTLATRQHWAIDVPAGALVAIAAHALVWRGLVTRQSVQTPIAAAASERY
jgi:membrane-associated phospholipid phosphatase